MDILEADASALPCVCCRVIPEFYPSEYAKIEHQRLSGLCPLCWYLEIIPPGVDDSDLLGAIAEMALYGVRPTPAFGRERRGSEIERRGLICMTCGETFAPRSRREHACAAVRNSLEAAREPKP
jgi:hypothetical protein